MTSQNDGHDEQAIRERCDAATRSGYVNDAVRSSKDIPYLLNLLTELREWKADVENSTKAAMDETCDADERHCTCVPLLRLEVKGLQGMVEKLRQFIRNDYSQYNSYHPYAVELRKTYPWLEEAATAAGVKHG